MLERIRASGRPLALFTNGSHVPPEAFAEGLRAVGLHVGDDEMLTPLRSVQVYLRALDRDVAVLLFGTDAAREYLVQAGRTDRWTRTTRSRGRGLRRAHRRRRLRRSSSARPVPCSPAPHC